MTVAVFPQRLELLSCLQRLVGIHAWTLDIGAHTLQIEIGRDFHQSAVHAVRLEDLRAILGAEDMQSVVTHWEDVARDGFAGPVLIPFVKADGTRTQVESAGCLHRSAAGSALLGVFRRPASIASNKNDALVRKERLLVEYVEAFIENSPSAICVVEPDGRVVSINHEFLRFLGKGQKSEALRQPLIAMLRAVDAGIGDTVREVIGSPRALRGRYEMQLQHNKRQTLYWRVFPLSISDSAPPQKVFAFDINAAGPRSG